MGRRPLRIEEVDALTAKSWMDLGEAFMIDVRRQRGRARRYIPGTISMPLDQLDPHALPGEAGSRIIFQCDVGATSLAVARRVVAFGIDRRIFNLSGGIQAWSAAGLPTAGTGFSLRGFFFRSRR